VLGVAFALGWAKSAIPHLATEAAFAFVAFFFLILGISMVAGSVNNPDILLDDLLPFLALTFFWLMRRRQSSM
jgi:hypothetical protein